jgi:hypothetical protein
MNKTGTIIVAHQPYFPYLIKLLNSFHQFVKKPHQIYVVFSNEYEEMIFQSMYGGEYNSIILPNELRGLKSYVNVKKLHALSLLYKKYDYIGVFDCDTLFVKDCDLEEIYSEIGDRNWVNSNEASVGADIIKKVATMLDYHTNENLLIESRGFTQYWWFSDIPVYKTEYVKEFMEWLEEHPNKNQILNEYHSFDYLLWSIWLIVNKDMRVHPKPFKDEIGVVENFRLNNRREILDVFQPYWAPDLSIHNDYPKIKIIVHADKSI